MQITDHRQQILLGVQRLRAMAVASSSSSCYRSPPLMDVDLPTASADHHSSLRKLELSYMAFASQQQTICPRTDSSQPVQLELLPLRPSCQKTVASRGRINFCGLGTNAVGPRGIDVNQMPSSSVSDDGDEEEAEEPALQMTGLSVAKLELAVCERGTDDPDHPRAFLEFSSRASDEDDISGSTRKKLRLLKEQSSLLEESFKEHSTLNPKEKSALAKQLNLRPRQVEVWFQNRRARTKLKQTEVDCELLKRCCESLTEENRRLQKEVAELRALKMGSPSIISHDFYMPLPAATLTMCPSCERLGPHGASSLPTPSAGAQIQPLSKSSQFSLTLAPHSQPSAAC